MSDDGLFPDPDPCDGEGNDDDGLHPASPDRGDGVDTPATSLGASSNYGQAPPGEVVYHDNGDVTVGAPVATAGVSSF